MADYLIVDTTVACCVFLVVFVITLWTYFVPRMSRDSSPGRGEYDRVYELTQELEQLKEMLSNQQHLIQTLTASRSEQVDPQIERQPGPDRPVQETSSVTLTGPTDRNMMGKVPKLPYFSGEGKGKDEATFDQWFYEAEALQGFIEEPLLKRAITLSLRGQAHAAIRNMPLGSTVAAMLSKLRSQFGATVDVTLKMGELLTIRQGKSELVSSYIARLEECYHQLKRAGGALGSTKSDTDAFRNLFLNGLRQSLSQKLYYLKHGQKGVSMEEAFSLAKLAEEEEQLGQKHEAVHKGGHARNKGAQVKDGDPQADKKGKKEGGPRRKLADMTCYFCKQKGHTVKLCKKLQDLQGKDKGESPRAPSPSPSLEQ